MQNNCGIKLLKGLKSRSRHSFPLRLDTFVGKISQSSSVCNLNLLQHFKRDFSSARKSGKYGQSMILLQDGLSIQELPIIIRKTNDVLTLCRNVESKDIQSSPPRFPKHLPDLDINLEDCNDFQLLFQALANLDAEQVTPLIALQAIQRIAQLNSRVDQEDGLKFQNGSFTLHAILLQLIRTLRKASDPYYVIKSLETLHQASFPGEVGLYREKLVEECVARTCDNQMTISQICEVISIISQQSPSPVPDQLWSAVLQNQNPILKDIDANLLSAFNTLPHLKASRRAVFSVLERKYTANICKLSAKDVLCVLDLVKELKLPSHRVCSATAKWMSLTLHTLDEPSVISLFAHFYDQDYTDSTIEKILERYMKARAHLIQDETLVTTVMRYCQKFRLRSPSICATAVSYFIKRGQLSSPECLEAVLSSFGHLNFVPEGFEFWHAVEEYLNCKFLQFRPPTMVDLMLACVYLERFPLNFVNRIFCPFFLERLLSSKQPEVLESRKQKLQVLDVALTLERKMYASPYLPRDYEVKSRVKDVRILRTAQHLSETLSKLAPDRTFFPLYILPEVPLVDYYIVDLALITKTAVDHYFVGKKPPEDTIAVLIHPVEHFTSDKNFLIGPQSMRCRHLLRLGFKLVNLELETVSRLIPRPEELMDYLRPKIDNPIVPQSNFLVRS